MLSGLPTAFSAIPIQILSGIREPLTWRYVVESVLHTTCSRWWQQGTGPVHMVGGVTALVAAIILGPRLGRFHDEDGNLLEEPNSFAPHSVALQFLGTFCLWFGWYGFNPGSVLVISSASSGQVAALVAVNTTLAACAGAVAAMFTSTLHDYHRTGLFTYDLGYTMNGCLTGLVSITGACATVEPWAAVVIGVIGAWVYLAASKLLVKLRIDDAVDAIPVHMCGGAWGLLATGLFTKGELLSRAFGLTEHVGWFYNGSDFTLCGIQLIAILFVFGWTAVIMGVFFLGLNAIGQLRIDPLEEKAGMDVSRHKGPAYTIEAVDDDIVDQLDTSRSGRHKNKLVDED